jgi:uncharacterized protein YnzC (UPF0291/DUF896 family)
MLQAKINRINELASLARERELTETELREREELRRDYLGEWRQRTEDMLKSVVIKEPDGTLRILQKKT